MRLAVAGLPVPPAFVLPTSWCRACRGTADDAALRDGAGQRASPGWKRRPAWVSAVPRRPLLVSVRSGAAVSMPGMLETVLDVGLTPPASRG